MAQPGQRLEALEHQLHEQPQSPGLFRELAEEQVRKAAFEERTLQGLFRKLAEEQVRKAAIERAPRPDRL